MDSVSAMSYEGDQRVWDTVKHIGYDRLGFFLPFVNYITIIIKLNDLASSSQIVPLQDRDMAVAHIHHSGDQQFV